MSLLEHIGLGRSRSDLSGEVLQAHVSGAGVPHTQGGDLGKAHDAGFVSQGSDAARGRELLKGDRWIRSAGLWKTLNMRVSQLRGSAAVDQESFEVLWPNIEAGILFPDPDQRRAAYNTLLTRLLEQPVTNEQAEIIAAAVVVDLTKKVEQQMIPTPLWKASQPMATLPSYPLAVLKKIRGQLSQSWQSDIDLITREELRPPFLDYCGNPVPHTDIPQKAAQWNRLTDAGLLFVLYRDSTHCSQPALEELTGRYAELGAFLMDEPALDLSTVSLNMYPYYKPIAFTAHEKRRRGAG
ncbi:MAG: hypothetical protein HQM16_02180 [Deltaproteobacteria bacterium]|nr:hypothetical protein [Deltaproteobacteria bacterium]